MMSGAAHHVALIFEGGGMRNSYSAGAVSVLLETGLTFDAVYGLSAGATNAIDYLSGDAHRAEASFTTCLDNLAFRPWLLPVVDADGVGATLNGDTLARPGCVLPFNFEAFQANPAQLTLQAVARDTGETVYFARSAFTTEQNLMTCVRASSSYPVIMPPTWIHDQALYDGGIGEGGGIMLPRAMRDGYTRFFVVCTRPRGYRRSLKPNRAYDVFFWRRPRMRALLDSWAQRYNDELDSLAQLEATGAACVFYATDQGVRNTERDEAKLVANFQRGRAQALKELPAWERFLGREG